MQYSLDIYDDTIMHTYTHTHTHMHILQFMYVSILPYIYVIHSFNNAHLTFTFDQTHTLEQATGG